MIQCRSSAIILTFIGVVLATAAATAIGGYSLSGTPAVETPTRTVSFEGQQYTIDAVSRISADGSVTITATAPANTTYDLQLRGPDNELIDTVEYSGNATHTFEYFGRGEAGTYAATIRDDGNTVAVYPIVIAGYDISVTQAADIALGANGSVSATVTERSVERHSSLDRVQVILGNDTVTRQATMTHGGTDTYETAVNTADLEPGTYRVYVVVRGDETVRGSDEILGVSETVTLTITSNERATGTGVTESDVSPATPGDARGTVTTPQQADDGIIDPSTPTTPAATGGSGPGFTLLVGPGVVLTLFILAGWRRLQ